MRVRNAWRHWLCMTLTLAVWSTAHGQIALDNSRPFYRVAREIELPDADRKFLVNKEFRDSLITVIPYRSDKQTLPLDEKNTFLLGEALADFEWRTETHGLVVAVDTNYGQRHYYFRTGSEDDVTQLRERRLQVLPEYMGDVSGQILDEADVFVVEALKLPWRYQSQPILIPEDAEISFGLTSEDFLINAEVRTVTSLGLDTGRRTPPVEASIVAISENEEMEIFRQTFAEDTALKPGAWLDLSASLAPVAGKRVRLEFRLNEADSKPADEVSGAFALATWSDPVVHIKSPTQPRQNLILISLDTLRADHLGCYGYERPTSPNLDAFAKEAVLFENCMSTSSWTAPAHASVFTGLPLSVHGTGTMHTWWRLLPKAETLAEHAQRAGFVTAAFTEGVAVNGSLGFYQGFSRYSNGVNQRARPGRAELVFRQGIDWLEQFGHLPFLLFLHTYEIHGPYHAPPGFRGVFAEAAPNGIQPSKDETRPEARQMTVDFYDEGIRYTDHVLGELLQWLRNNNFLENTSIIIFSDHGEEFWEHGNVGHGRTLYQEQLHVPLLIRPAGKMAEGRRIAEHVSLLDLFATSVNLLDLQAAIPPDSLNLQALWMRTPEDFPQRDTLMAELYQMDQKVYYLAGLHGPWKYIATAPFNPFRSTLAEAPYDRASPPGSNEVDFLKRLQQDRQAVPGSYALYNLKKDAEEQQPNQNPQGDVLPAIEESLIQRLGENSEWAQQNTGPGQQDDTPLSESERAALEALGYL